MSLLTFIPIIGQVKSEFLIESFKNSAAILELLNIVAPQVLISIDLYDALKFFLCFLKYIFVLFFK